MKQMIDSFGGSFPFTNWSKHYVPPPKTPEPSILWFILICVFAVLCIIYIMH